MVYRYNPFIGNLDDVGNGSGSGITQLDGNTGSASGSTVNIVGTGAVTVTGDDASTLTIADDGTYATTYDGDTGSATPSLNTITFAGTAVQGIRSSATMSTVTYTIDDASTTQKGVLETSTDSETVIGTSSSVSVVPSTLKTKLGTQTQYAISYGDGSTKAIQWTTAGTDGQLVIAATGAAPAFASLTSSGGTITVTAGANTLNIDTDGSIANQYDGNTGTATPSSGILNVVGDNTLGINITGATDTLTVKGIDATTSQKGVLETSTDAESIAGSSTTTAVTPESLKAKLGAQTAYAVICGGTTAQTTALQSIASVGTSGQILTSNGAAALPTFQDAAPGGLTWSVITDSTDDLEASNGYFANNATSVTFTLPATASVGDTFEVVAMHASGTFIIAQNAGQTIQVGNTATTTGAGGTITSTDIGDWIQIVCNVTDTGFHANVKQGNLTLV
jgi:hypothetical protein